MQDSWLKQLKYFGLNPRDWRLTDSGEREFVIVHRREDDLRFRGTVIAGVILGLELVA